MQVLRRPWGAMHFVDEGPRDGVPVVFANSLGTDYRLWDPLIPLLPAGLRIIRYDKRGHGLSDLSGEVTIEALAEDAAALIEALDLGPVVFVGLSIGGLIGQSLVASRPEMLRGLVLSNTAARIGTVDMWNSRIAAIRDGGLGSIADGVMERWFGKAFRSKSEMTLWRNMLIRTPEEGYLAASAAIAGADLTASAGAIRLPVLLIAGAEDGATPPELMEATAKLIPNSAFHIIKDAGHLPCVEAPDAYAALLNPFLTEIMNG